MKEGIFMKQKLLDEVQNELTRIRKMKQQIEDTKKQLDKKKKEIFQFKKEWNDNCKHIFYRVQSPDVFYEYYETKGYHCCLCGKFIEEPNKIREYRGETIHHIEKEKVKNYIGTVRESLFGGLIGDFAIPTEYQAEVDRKRDNLDKLKTEEKNLAEKLKELEVTTAKLEEDLRECAHLLNGFFGYPEIVYEEYSPYRRNWD